MKSRVRALIEAVSSMVRDRRVRFKVISTLAVVLFLQLYFVRELLAAEILFGVGFLSLLVLGGILYALGEIGERGFNLTEAGVRVLAVSARRGYVTLEEMSRKALRPTRSRTMTS